MDIDQVRRDNIRIIEQEFGSASALASAVGMSVTQYVNLRDGAKDSKTGKPRGMRKETAWKFEDAGHKNRGWLDQDHSAQAAISPEDERFISEIGQGVVQRDVPEHVRKTILTLITSLPEKKK